MRRNPAYWPPVKRAAAHRSRAPQVLWARAESGAGNAQAAGAAARRRLQAKRPPGPCARKGGRGNPRAGPTQNRLWSSPGSGDRPGGDISGTHRRAERESAPPAPRPRDRAAPASAAGPKGSLRDAAVGCPERAQVGPLPWRSKSRLWGFPAGIWSAIRTPGSLLFDCWATRTNARPFGSQAILPVRFLRRHHPDMELFELGGIGWARRAEHQVLMALRLWKRNHVADVSVLAIVIMRRSIPDAIPPCGGTPYSNASSR